MITQSTALMFLLVLLISLTFAPNVQAQTTSITNLQYPNQAVLQNGVAHATVTYTVSFSGLPSGDILAFGILYGGTTNYVTGSGTSTPDSPQPVFAGTRFANSAFIATPPASSFGTESVSFSLTFNAPQQPTLIAFAVIEDKTFKVIGVSTAESDFTISVTGQAVPTNPQTTTVPQTTTPTSTPTETPSQTPPTTATPTPTIGPSTAQPSLDTSTLEMLAGGVIVVLVVAGVFIRKRRKAPTKASE